MFARLIIEYRLFQLSKSGVGSNRIVPTISIPYPLGDPATTSKEQFKLRYHRVGVALDALSTDIKEQTVFKVKI